MSVTVGDRVLVPEYGGTKLKFDDEVMMISLVSQFYNYNFSLAGLYATKGW